MLRMSGKDIYLTRGDSASFNLVIYNGNSIYNLQEGDNVVFTIRQEPKKTPSIPTPLLNKVFNNNVVVLNPKDTNFLQYGQYKYDVQVTFSDGGVNTIVAGSIYLMSEVS